MQCLRLLASWVLGSRGPVEFCQHRASRSVPVKQAADLSHGFGAWFVPSGWAMSVCLVKPLQNLCLTAVGGLCGLSTSPKEWAAVWSQQLLTHLGVIPLVLVTGVCRLQINRTIPKQWYPLQASTKTGFCPWWSKVEAFCRPGLCPALSTCQWEEWDYCGPAHPSPSWGGL